MLAALRLISLILIVVALMLLGADVITSLEKGGEITVRSIEQVWSLITERGLEEFKAWLENHLPIAGVNGVEAFLRLPGWAVFGVVGVILAFAFGRRAADIDTE